MEELYNFLKYSYWEKYSDTKYNGKSQITSEIAQMDLHCLREEGALFSQFINELHTGHTT